MKNFFVALAMMFLPMVCVAQVPNFATTVGDGKLYGYSALNTLVGSDVYNAYTTFQYGVGSDFAFGVSYSSSEMVRDFGVTARFGHEFSKWIKVGAQLTPMFDMNDKFSFAYLSGGLYGQGQITNDGNLFWLSNTWLDVNDDGVESVSQYWYLCRHFNFENGNSITPMLGLLHSWEFDEDLNVAAGFYYSYKLINLYLWGDRFFEDNPRLNIGLEFAF